MSRQRGWVSVSVQTYQSHRTSAQRITNREYTVDETGATLAANSRDAPEEEPEQQPSTTPTSGPCRPTFFSGLYGSYSGAGRI